MWVAAQSVIGLVKSDIITTYQRLEWSPRKVLCPFGYRSEVLGSPKVANTTDANEAASYLSYSGCPLLHVRL